MRAIFFLLLLSIFGMVVAFAESLDPSGSFDNELTDSDYSEDLSSELLASNPCSENPNPNRKVRARRNFPKLCRPRKRKPSQTEDSFEKASENIDSPFPVPVPTAGSDDDMDFCAAMSVGLLPYGLCESGNPKDVERYYNILWGMMTWKLSFATIGQSHVFLNYLASFLRTNWATRELTCF